MVCDAAIEKKEKRMEIKWWWNINGILFKHKKGKVLINIVKLMTSKILCLAKATGNRVHVFISFRL